MMAYHMFIPKGSSLDDVVFDHYLGSAYTLDLYWESVGRRLGLPIISSITERADSEDGFLLTGSELLDFKKELIQLDQFWKNDVSNVGTPEDFSSNLAKMISALDHAVVNGYSLYVA
ncbi:hypothetical protein [Pseudoduganella sp. HUAS MS19]